MGFSKHIDFNNLQIPHQLSYYQIPYLKTQDHSQIQIFKDDNFFIPFSIKEKAVISIEKSPFGSFLKLNSQSPSQFETFEKEVLESLQQNHLDEIFIKHPSSIYSDFVDSSELTKVGYSTFYNDINQHIVLSESWEDQIHKMQSRKLNSLEQDGFEFRKIENTQVEKVYQFLTVCRQAQGLQINISLEKLEVLNKSLPDTYDFFGVFRENKMSAVCIAVKVTKDVAYYYLPGTSPLFRSHSPMVLLIAGMVSYYRKKGFKYLDLGVSSLEGKPQETLRLFKERMGSVETKKPTFLKSLK